MRFIGITGGVGAGKSAILNYLKQHYKCQIYLADDIANELKEPGRECYSRIVELLGPEVCSEDGRIDKGRMASAIFNDATLLEKINEIIHPEVRTFLLDRLEEAKLNDAIELFFVEAALLLECGYDKLVDEMWYVYADEGIRRERLKSTRGYSDEKIDAIMKSQLTEAEFRKGCDFVLDNSGDLEGVYRQIDDKLEEYTWLA